MTTIKAEKEATENAFGTLDGVFCYTDWAATSGRGLFRVQQSRKAPRPGDRIHS